MGKYLIKTHTTRLTTNNVKEQCEDSIRAIEGSLGKYLGVMQWTSTTISNMMNQQHQQCDEL